MDTFSTLWSRVQLRVPAAGPDLCQDFIRDAFQQLAERRMWSWLIGTGSFAPPVFAAPGTVSVTPNSAYVAGVGTSFTPDLIGAQINVAGASSYPFYTVLQVSSAVSLVMDRPWVGPALATQPYTLFQALLAAPADFQHWLSITCPSNNYRLNHNATRAEFDSYDPQRSQSGDSYACAFYDYDALHQGRVGPGIRIKGAGAAGAPVFSTAEGYSYPEASLYAVEITAGGDSGTATFRWQQDAGITQGAGILTSQSPIGLSNGVQVYFPVGTPYNLGDVFVSVCQADATSGVPRYELWPRPVGASRLYHYSYARQLPALTDEQPALPPPIARRGDVLVEMALTNLALWPGTSNQPNPYRDPMVSQMHRKKAEDLIYELEKKDDDTAIRDLIYTDLPYMGPWRDGSWLQTHAVYPYV